ncbi:carboxylesterase family protein [soil metagenome]
MNASRLIAGLALVASLALSGSAQAAGPPKVRIDSGALVGVEANGVSAFKGIPFAAPPVGALRWLAPQRAAHWTGDRAADAYGAPCMQALSKDNGLGQAAPSEDCLTVNVWSPDLKPAKKLPVMVWIHGGGYTGGSGTALLYDGTELAKQGVVLVTLNYRLGRFGFFAHPALSAEAKGKVADNFGMLDMIAALQWVKRNAAAFGGDASNVTIFGESAGGAAVHALMVSPQARGLFAKAISESGAGRAMPAILDKPGPRGMPSAVADGEAFAKKLGASTVTELRALPADKIQAAGALSVFSGGGPVIDGVTLPMGPVEAFSKGKQAKVPFLIGANNVELPGTLASYKNTAATWGGASEAQLAELAKYYPDPDTFALNVAGEMSMVEPARWLAGVHARSNPTWLYRFSVVTAAQRPGMKGARHAQERQYVFRTLSASPWKTDANDEVQAKAMSAYWVAFAKTGNPNTPGLPAWPAFTAQGDQLLEFTDNGPVAGTSPFAERLNAIASVRAAAP